MIADDILIEALPKTADGVPIVPRMRLWMRISRLGENNRTYRVAVRCQVRGVSHDEVAIWDYTGMPVIVTPKILYSTEAAAEAAKEK